MAGVMMQEPAQMVALHQADVVNRGGGMPSLALDHQRVLSAWEKMGGEVDVDYPFPDASGAPMDLFYWNLVRQDPHNDSLTRCSDCGEDSYQQQFLPVAPQVVPGVSNSEVSLSDSCRCIRKEAAGSLCNVPEKLTKGLHGSDVGAWSLASTVVLDGASDASPDKWPSEPLPDFSVGDASSPLECIETKPVINESFMEAVNGVLRGDTENSSTLSSYVAASVTLNKMLTPSTSPMAGDNKPHGYIDADKITTAIASIGFSSSSPPVVPAVPIAVPFATGINRVSGGVGAAEGRTRKECLERYREKRARRMYTKKIRYELRKINADRRPRIKGRFVKKEELEQYIKQQALLEEKTKDPDVLDVSDSYNSADLDIRT